MTKLINILGAVSSTAVIMTMVWIGVEAIPTEATASVDPQVEIEPDPLSLHRPVQRPSLWERSSAEERECMALNIYHEARGEPIRGQIAVAQVTLNRVELDHYPDTICGVVWQRRQFSWTHDGLSDVPREHEAWIRSQAVAQMVMEGWGEDTDITHGADHYHAHWVTPGWADPSKATVEIGVHTFYRLL